MSDLIELTTDAGELRLSARIARSPSPRSTIIALHGGGLHSGYFDGRTHPDISLLDLGRALGHTVVAIDRPGYGSSTGRVRDAQTTLAMQAALIWEAVDQAVDGGSSPLCLLGHSFGSMVALTMGATQTRRHRLAGIEISGIGTMYSDALQNDPAAAASRETHWGPERYYPARTFDPGVRPHAPLPGIEAEEAIDWPDRVVDTAARISVPVSLTVAEREVNWSNTQSEFADLFTSAPSVTMSEQQASGHNMSLGWSARPYHLRTIAFFEDCLNRIQIPPTSRTPR